MTQRVLFPSPSLRVAAWHGVRRVCGARVQRRRASGGKREAEEKTVAVRRFGSKDQNVVSLDTFIEQFKQEIADKQ